MNALESIRVQEETLFPGKLVNLAYEGEEIEAIVIDPNGLGEGNPTFGMGLRMTERHVGIDQTTLSRWIKKDAPPTDANYAASPLSSLLAKL